ncbi:ParB/RepB/Spo0J family partition protein [Streptomyces triticagri]|nr:ParB N-terminal domain-containing protein [Streptomyces triticagri]
MISTAEAPRSPFPFDLPGGLATTTVRVPTDTLLDADSPRLSGVDEDHVRALAETDEALPPIIVHRSTMRVIDGMHRLHALRLNKAPAVEVIYFDGTERDAFLLAVESNIKHGLPLTLSDRRESARRILSAFPEWSDRAIAAKSGLSGKTVGALRRSAGGELAQPAVRVGRDGRIRPLSPAEGRLKAGELLAREPAAPLREIAKFAGVSVETARDVRERLSRGEGPVPARRAEKHTEVPRVPRRAAVAVADPLTHLDSLRRDPAVKYSDTGRVMIRWLETRLIRKSDARLVLDAPVHQSMKIAAMARACAAYWEDIADRLEQRGSECA